MATKEFSKNLVTTITGVVLMIVTILATVGVLTLDQATVLQTQLGVIGTAISSIVAAVSAIVLIFKAKDE
jgi:hypothetical protein